MTSIDTNISFQHLPIAQQACFDSHDTEGDDTCLPNTRVELLDTISHWITDPDSRRIFWLNGMAGTGKSTISRTLSHRRHEAKDLGATFFFKRGETDRSGLTMFVSTLARQLANRVPELRAHIKSAIDLDATITSKAVKEQFKRLIVEPLVALSTVNNTLSPIVFVIDALDECERDEDIGLLIRLFSAEQCPDSLKLRVLITSRPELPIRLGFSEPDAKYSYDTLILHDMPASTIEHDIAIFLQYHLAKVKVAYNQLDRAQAKVPEDWPGQDNIKKLVTMASPLFIFASTICRLVGDMRWGDPQRLLEEFLVQKSNRSVSKLHFTYHPALKQQFVSFENHETREREKVVTEFRHIVGAIVTLFNPLSATSLSQLLDIAQSIIDHRIEMLHSVLNVPKIPDSPIRLLHLSFRDYLVDPEQREVNEFWIDEEDVHQNLFRSCLRVMRCHLRKDICNIQQPGAYRSQIPSERIKKHVPPELEYACLYWIPHLIAKNPASDMEDVYSFLAVHLLHWIEVLTLLRKCNEGVPLLMKFQDWWQVSQHHCYSTRTEIYLTSHREQTNTFSNKHYETLLRMQYAFYASVLVQSTKRPFKYTLPHCFHYPRKVTSECDSDTQYQSGCL